MIVALEMWEDFFNYEGGIYEQTAGAYTGGHSMKLIGWGVEEDVKYWVLQN
jgi:cathepsin B